MRAESALSNTNTNNQHRRANGTPSNMPAFAAAFGCKEGDPMVPGDDKRIAIW